MKAVLADIKWSFASDFVNDYKAGRPVLTVNKQQTLKLKRLVQNCVKKQCRLLVKADSDAFKIYS